jgi:uncharacterized protein
MIGVRSFKTQKIMRNPHFEIFCGRDNKFEFRLKAANGEPVLFGPGYRTKSEAVRGVADVMYHGVSSARFVQKERADGQFYFQLKSPIGRLLGWSEYYTTRVAMLNGIRAARTAAKKANITDLVQG